MLIAILTIQFPAIFALYAQGHLPEKVRIFGYARTDLSDDDFRERLSSKFEYVGPNTKEKGEEFKKLCHYVQGAYDKDEGFAKLNKAIEDAEKELVASGDKPNRLFYLALPPVVFGGVCSHLKSQCYLGGEDGHTRVIIEKPFGHDLKSSRELQEQLAPLFNESEIYRIDHYLGKEMVKNILIFRFANLPMTSWWSNQYVKTVQITFKEPFGTEGRGGYFDDIGIIRDVMQNHLCQVLSLIAMERPLSFDPEHIRDEKVRVLKAVTKIDPKNVVLGQYGSDGKGHPGYLDDDSIKNKDSKTPTYAALALEIQNERWEGVPFILKAGKALNESKVEIRIQLRPVSRGIFHDITPNEVVLRVQPNETIYMKVNTKYPGLSTQTVTTDLDFTYHRRFTNLVIPQAYESLILDCLKGDHSNFVRDDELDEAWKIFTPLLKDIDDGKYPLEVYDYGSRGPKSVAEFVERMGYTIPTHDNYIWTT